MTNKEELKQLLRELNNQGNSAGVKERAAEFLKDLDPKTLSLAEQELMQEGFSPEELRARKRRLAKLVEQAGRTGFTEFTKQLTEVGSYIVDALKDHTFKEDNILYPTALKTLEPGEWNKVAEEFNRIGYCCFTPAAHPIVTV